MGGGVGNEFAKLQLVWLNHQSFVWLSRDAVLDKLAENTFLSQKIREIIVSI